MNAPMIEIRWSNSGASSWINLASVRDLLLPGLYGAFAGSDITANIEIHYENGSLTVSAWRLGVAPLGFVITREEIVDGEFKQTFCPKCRELRDQLLAIPAGRVQ